MKLFLKLLMKDTLTLIKMTKFLDFKRNKEAPDSFKSENMNYIKNIYPGRV